MTTSAGTYEGSADDFAERSGDSVVQHWLLLDGNRWLVALVPLGAITAAVVALGAYDVAPLDVTVEEGQPTALFRTLAETVIVGTTLVIAINQIVLSQELGPIGDQRERMEGALSFRDDVSDLAEVDSVPAEPASFIRLLVDCSENYADQLSTAAPDDSKAASFAASIRDNADRVRVELEGGNFGSFAVLGAALDYLHEARKLRAHHDGDDEVAEALDELVSVFRLFGPTREHVKTLYFQWELAELSKALLYTAVPALGVAIVMVLYFDATSIGGTVLTIPIPVWMTSLALAVVLLPFMILLAYVVRISTVAKRTLAIGPFVLQSDT